MKIREGRYSILLAFALATSYVRTSLKFHNNTTHHHNTCSISLWLIFARLCATHTTPATFAELSLNWMEFYHKSDNINVRTLDITLDIGGNWGQTDTLPLLLDSMCPYLGQLNHDGADYELLPVGIQFIVTELGKTQSHTGYK